MNRPRREIDIELALGDVKPSDIHNGDTIDNKNKHVSIVTSPRKPHFDGEFLDQEARRRGEGAGDVGKATDGHLPENIPPLAEPEHTDELSEPRTPLPAHLPHPPALADENESEKTEPTNSVTSADNGHGQETDELLTSERAHNGYDEIDMHHAVFNGEIHDRFGTDRPGSPALTMIGTTLPDLNTYQQKKNLAQGMMDLALLSANANQLRYVLESSASHPYYYPSLVLISLSLVLQVLVGVGLIMNSRYNVKDDADICKADKINNMTVLGVFLVTIVNVFITSFSVGATATIERTTA